MRVSIKTTFVYIAATNSITSGNDFLKLMWAGIFFS